MKVFIGLLVLCGTYSLCVSLPQPHPCIGQVDGELFVVPGECSQFFICFDGEEALNDCGSGLHFNPETKTCIEASKSVCKQGGQQLNIEKPKPETELLPTSICAGKSIGDFIASKISCNEYFVCIGSKPMVKKCQQGLHFSQDSNSCIEQRLSNCVIEVTVPEEEKPIQEKPQLAAPIETTLSIENMCLGQLNGAMFPVPESCSKYFACLQHRPFEQSCGLKHYDPSTRSCIEAETSNCMEGKVVGNLNSVVKVKETVIDKDAENKDRESSIIKNVVSEGELIVNNKKISIKKTGLPVSKKESTKVDIVVVASDATANELAINAPIANTNLDSSNEVSAEQTPNENEIEVVYAVVDESSSRACDGMPSGTLIPRIGNCKEFITCESGVAFVANCPRGLHFNGSAKFCDWPELAGCA